MSPKGATNASILCKRHNSILSGLDTLSARFYSALTFPDQADKCSNPKVSLFNGHDVERLMTKMLCGSFASNGEWKPPLPVLNAMFGDNDLPDGCGLYISPNNGQATFGVRGVSITPVTDRSGNIMGGGFIEISGCQFLLNLYRNAHWAYPVQDYEYRRNGMELREDERSKFVLFGWNENVNNTLWNLTVQSNFLLDS